MYDTIIRWIGAEACTFAGSLADIVDAGPACLASQAWNMGAIALGIAVLSVVVMAINARRRHHRETYFRR